MRSVFCGFNSPQPGDRGTVQSSRRFFGTFLFFFCDCERPWTVSEGPPAFRLRFCQRTYRVPGFEACAKTREVEGRFLKPLSCRRGFAGPLTFGRKSEEADQDSLSGNV